MSKFADFPYFTIDEYLSGVQFGSIGVSGTNSSGILRGPEKGITVSGGNYIQLYIKSDITGIYHYYPTNFNLAFTGKLSDNEDIFTFIDGLFVNIVAGAGVNPPATTLLRGVTGINGGITGIYYDTTTGNAYTPPTGVTYYNEDITFYTRDTGNVISKGINIDIDGNEVYFRKDSAFHDWIINALGNSFQAQYGYSINFRDYINTDKDFIYFGKIFQIVKDINNPSLNLYHIEFTGIKDYVENCLPSNNRNPNLKVFLDSFFDKLYNRNYNLLKDIWSTIDAFECDKDMLYFIEKYYGVERVTRSESNLLRREYLNNIIYFLKSKGTYASVYLLYKIISKNSTDILNIFEKWHGITAPYTPYTKFLYTSEYGIPQPTGGAGSSWYNQYPTNQYPVYDTATNQFVSNALPIMNSTQYEVNVDITHSPLSSSDIISKTFTDDFFGGCRELRPINKIDNYSILLGIKTSAQSNISQQYSNYNNYMINYMTDTVNIDGKSIIQLEMIPNSVWHSDLLIRADMGNGQRAFVGYRDSIDNNIVPTSISIDTSNVTGTFSSPQTGLSIISMPDSYGMVSSGFGDAQVTHNLNDTHPVIMAYNETNGIGNLTPDTTNTIRSYTGAAVKVVSPTNNMSLQFLKPSFKLGSVSFSMGGVSIPLDITYGKAIFFTIYDNATGNVVYPTSFYYTEDNSQIVTCHITTSYNFTGTLSYTSVGDYYSTSSMIPVNGNNLTCRVGYYDTVTGRTKKIYSASYYNDANTGMIDYNSGISVPITSYATGIGSYFTFDIIPNKNNSKDIIVKELGINNSNVLFNRRSTIVYSTVSDIYLPLDVDLQVYYKMYTTNSNLTADNPI